LEGSNWSFDVELKYRRLVASCGVDCSILTARCIWSTWRVWTKGPSLTRHVDAVAVSVASGLASCCMQKPHGLLWPGGPILQHLVADSVFFGTAAAGGVTVACHRSSTTCCATTSPQILCRCTMTGWRTTSRVQRSQREQLAHNTTRAAITA
jgi:hypothetical protein